MNKNNEKLNRLAAVIAKITEIFYWVATGLLIVSLIVFCLNDAFLHYFMDLGDSEFAFSGYSVQPFSVDGRLIPAIFIPTLIIVAITGGLMAMVFRNIYLIFKTTAGETKFSKGKTPFQPSNVRMLREIGIFVLSIPAVEYIGDVIIRILAGPDLVESSISVSGIVFGIALLCLSQFFAYGVQLQSDADGLL